MIAHIGLRRAGIVLGTLVVIILMAPGLARWSGHATLATRELPRGTDVSIDADGRTLNVIGERSVTAARRRSGDGDEVRIVLVHGRPGGAAFMTPLAHALQSRGVHALVYDRAGYGESGPRPADIPATFATNARELAALLAHIDAPPVWLVGYSYGGGVVQALATIAPTHVGGVILVSSVDPHRTRSRPGVLGRLLFSPSIMRWAMGFDAIARALSEDAMSALFAPHAIDPAIRDDLLAALVRSRGIEAWIAEGRADEPRSDHTTRGALRAPVLILHGDQDAVVPVATATTLATRLSGSVVQILNDTGHSAIVSEADAVAGAIVRFIRSQRDAQHSRAGATPLIPATVGAATD